MDAIGGGPKSCQLIGPLLCEVVVNRGGDKGLLFSLLSPTASLPIYLYIYSTDIKYLLFVRQMPFLGECAGKKGPRANAQGHEAGPGQSALALGSLSWGFHPREEALVRVHLGRPPPNPSCAECPWASGLTSLCPGALLCDVF